MQTLCVVQHTEGEYLGLMEDHFESRSLRFIYARPFTAGGSIPASAEGFAGLILLGAGPRGVVSGELLPSLNAETRLTQAFLDAGLPVIGIGTGSLILARACGCTIEAAPLRFEIGHARRTRDDALAGFMPPRFAYASYLRDRIRPDADTEVLAVDEADAAPMVFRLRGNCLGFTAHPGIKTGMIEDLVMEFDEAPENIPERLAHMTLEQHAIADALSSLMVGIVKVCGLMS